MNRIEKMYQEAKEAPIRSEVVCPMCSTKFIKKTSKQAFCSTRELTTCKDAYWHQVKTKWKNIKSTIAIHVTPIVDAFSATYVGHGDGSYFVKGVDYILLIRFSHENVMDINVTTPEFMSQHLNEKLEGQRAGKIPGIVIKYNSTRHFLNDWTNICKIS